MRIGDCNLYVQKDIFISLDVFNRFSELKFIGLFFREIRELFTKSFTISFGNGEI